MTVYRNFSCHSGVIAYEIWPDRVFIMFHGGKVYEYSYWSVGMMNVEQMKVLARLGIGLNRFINKNCRHYYVK